MNDGTLVLRGEHLDQLSVMAVQAVEHAAVLLVGVADTAAPRLLVREVWPIKREDMERQTATELVIRSEGYMPALRRGEDIGAHAMFVHTHPGERAEFSERDDRVDDLLAPVFETRTGRSFYGSLVITSGEGSLKFGGRIRYRGEHGVIARIFVASDRIRLIASADRPAGMPAEVFDRHVRAYGPAFQQLFSALTFGIAGCGGTGSAVAEQLTRLGAGVIHLLDDDVITNTNLTRIHESTRGDVGRKKIDAVADRLRAAGTGTRIVTTDGRITSEDAARTLRECDVIFGCTDDEGGRAVLSRLATWYLVPVFDLGFVIDSTAGEVRSLTGRITTLGPGSRCLLCRGRISATALHDDALTPEERRRLAAEGYARGLAENDPAVIPYTTLVASLAVSELIERIVGYDQPPPNELLVVLEHRRLLRTTDRGSPTHWCGQSERWGIGDDDPFLGQTWLR